MKAFNVLKIKKIIFEISGPNRFRNETGLRPNKTGPGLRPDRCTVISRFQFLKNRDRRSGIGTNPGRTVVRGMKTF